MIRKLVAIVGTLRTQMIMMLGIKITQMWLTYGLLYQTVMGVLMILRVGIAIRRGGILRVAITTIIMIITETGIMIMILPTAVAAVLTTIAAAVRTYVLVVITTGVTTTTTTAAAVTIIMIMMAVGFMIVAGIMVSIVS